MEKENIAAIISDIFIPIGFKRKGNYWVANGDEITKMINLQKSQYSNSFYVNYSFIVKSIPLDGLMMPIYKTLGSKDSSEQNRIIELLALDNAIPDKQRALELQQFIKDKIVRNFGHVNNEEDLLKDIYTLPTLNMVPGVVKKHFKIGMAD